MFNTESASTSVKFSLLEGQLLAHEIDRDAFVARAANLGLPASTVGEAADKFLAIAANQATRRATLRSSFDYIVIGSGASGSVVARRLAENRDMQVLLLEAGGGDLEPGILITETWFFNQGGEFDWKFRAERSPSVNNRSIAQAMGKALGGGTSINGMVWARGHKNDFDYWARAAGDDTWDYQHVLGIYRRIEDWHGAPDPQRRGHGGEVFVQPAPDPSTIAPAFLAGARSLDIATFADQNGVMQEGPGGAAITNVRIRDGRRLNVPSGYLYPVMDQPNLTVLTNAHVNRLKIEGKTVTGVEFEWQGRVRMIAASSEVVLSAGAIQTPKLLMLSGIGDRAELDRFGISTVSHLPGVGQNLQDHPIIGGGLWEAPGPLPTRNNAAEANLFTKSRPELETPDLHIWHVEAPYLSEVTAGLVVPNVWSISPGLARPESRGFLRLQSDNPREPMQIHANMLSDPRDLAALRKSIGNRPRNWQLRSHEAFRQARDPAGSHRGARGPGQPHPRRSDVDAPPHLHGADGSGRAFGGGCTATGVRSEEPAYRRRFDHAQNNYRQHAGTLRNHRRAPCRDPRGPTINMRPTPMTQRLDYTNIAPDGVKALSGVYSYIRQTSLPHPLVNLVYLRVSQINGCVYCIDMHSRDLIKEGFDVEKLVLVQAWYEAGKLFDARERGALAWAETVTRVADTTVPDADFEAASAVFSAKELADLTIAITLSTAAWEPRRAGTSIPRNSSL